MIEINKYKLVPAITATWGDITGDITKQQDLVDYVATHGGGGGEAVWGSIAGDISDQEDLNALLANYAMKEWVENKGYITSSALSGYATETWVGNQGYITSSALSGYATQEWVEGQDYYAPETAHAPVEYHDLAEDPDIEFEYPGYNPKTKRLIEPGVDGFVIGDYYDATGPTINPDEIRGIYFGKDHDGHPIAGKYSYYMYEKPAGVFTPTEEFYPFVTEDDLSGYATKSWVNNKSYATQKWVNDKGYITSAALSGYATETWVGQQGYIDQIKTVNNQSLVGEGNITISGLTPAQEAAIAPLEETSEGMLYTLDLEQYRGKLVGSEVINDSEWVQHLYNIDGVVYLKMYQNFYKFNPETLDFEFFKRIDDAVYNYPLWKDNTGRFYCGPEVEIDFEQGTCTPVSMNCDSYSYAGNRQSIWKGQYGIYNLTSGQKFDESTQEFVSWTVNIDPMWDLSIIGGLLAQCGVEYDGHYVTYTGDRMMFELIEYQDRIEIVEVSNPYFPNTAVYYGTPITFEYGNYYNISGDLYYLYNSYTYRLVSGQWVRFDCTYDRGGFSFRNWWAGVIYDDLLIGHLSAYFNGFYDVISVSASVKKTYWTPIKNQALDYFSEQYVTGTKHFEYLYANYMVDVQSISMGDTNTFDLNTNTTNARSINFNVSGDFRLNGIDIATADDCIKNKTSVPYGPIVVDVVNDSGINCYRSQQWVTNTGRMFNGNNEFVGGSWVPATPLQDSQVDGRYVVQAGSKTFYVNGSTYLWDDVNDEFVMIVQNAPTVGWGVWPCGDGVLRCNGDYKLVNNGGTWSWESDTVQDYIYGMTYYINGHVYVLCIDDSHVYEYDESTKTYTTLGYYSSWLDSSFSACGQIFFPYNGEEIRMIDFSLVDPLDTDKSIDVPSGIPYSAHDYFYGEYDDKVYFYREWGVMSYCYGFQYDTPAVPATDGNYVLRATRSGDNITYSWVPEV